MANQASSPVSSPASSPVSSPASNPASSSAESALEQSEQEKIRQQFDQGPYPRIPLEGFPKDDYEQFFINSLVTPHYLHHRQVINTEGKLILDAGCGSGYKALVLAMANPGARVVGIDLSQESVDLARRRFEFHKLDGAEFHQLSLYDVAQLGLKFDYINCDETLYLLPDPAAGLQTLKAVLKPNGILRANLHSAYERAELYRAQALFKFAGLLDAAPGEAEREAVVETMNALNDGVRIKADTWLGRRFAEADPDKLAELISTNFLLVGDKGYTIPDLFNLLNQVDLEFVSMVNWRRWDVLDLFKDLDSMPLLWNMGLAEASIQDKLHLYELMHPVHRLMDFWCTHPSEPGQRVDDWSDAQWQAAVVHLHPHLRNDRLKTDLIQCIETNRPFEISHLVKLPALQPVLLEADLAACLLPLWEGAQSIHGLAERYRQINPVDLITLEPLSPAQAFETVKTLLNRLDAFLYVLLETAANA
ncbi:MAG: class I SAM-dependent methyltransferase [Elainella sp.]